MNPRDHHLSAMKARLRLSDFVGQRVKLSSGHGDRFGLCPFHEEKRPSFTVNDAKGFYHCFGCGAHGDVLDWWQKVEGLTFTDAVERLRREAGAMPPPRPDKSDGSEDREAAKKQAAARAIWDEARPIGGTIAETYLRSARRISIDLPDCLRFHPGLRWDTGNPDLLPAMVAAVTDEAGAVVAIQRTFLRLDGAGKAPIERPKRALGPVKLGAVRLGPPALVIGVAEGIETGLSAQELFGVPIWCALGSNLARNTFPPGVRFVGIFADRGEAGERAATLAAKTFMAAGLRVAVKFPTTGKDFNDDLKARRRGTS